MGLTKEDIGRALGYERSSFYKAKSENAEIEAAILRGRSKFKVIVSRNLVDQMKRGNVTAAIWLDKTRCGTREIKEKTQQTADDVGKIAKQGGMSEATAKEIRQRILGIV